MKTSASNFGKTLALAGAVFLLASASAFALEVAALKQDGAACEGADGYLHVKKSTPEIEEFVKGKNAERKAKYDEIAKSKSTKDKPVTTEAVGILTAEKLDHRCN